MDDCLILSRSGMVYDPGQENWVCDGTWSYGFREDLQAIVDSDPEKFKRAMVMSREEIEENCW